MVLDSFTDPMATHAFCLTQHAVASPTCYKTQNIHTIEAPASYIHVPKLKGPLVQVQVTIASSSSPKSSKFKLL